MSNSFSEVKRKALEQRKAALAEEFQAANEQLMSTLDETQRLRLKRKINKIETEIKDVEEQIQQLDSESTESPVDGGSSPSHKSLPDSKDLSPSDTATDESEVFRSLARDLTAPHLRMLKVLYQPQKYVPEDIRFQTELRAYETSLQDILHNVFADALEGFVDGIWSGLSMHGLVDASSYKIRRRFIKPSPYPGQMTDHTDEVFQQLPNALTPFGRRFVEFSIDLDESAGGSRQPEGGKHVPVVDSLEVSGSRGGDSESRKTEVNAIKHLLDSLGERMRWLWLYYLTIWLAVSALGFVASLVEVFGLAPCTRLTVFALLAFLGGVAILGYSLVPSVKQRYKDWDRWLTLVLLLAATGSLGLFAYRSCTSGVVVTPTPSSPEYQVRVEAKGTGEVIQSAKVTIEMGGGRAPKNEYTDANGIARIPFDVSLAGRPARLIAEAEGYKRTVENIDLTANELPHVVQLEPGP